MRALGFGLVLLGTAVGLTVACGSSTDDGSKSGGAGTANGGTSTSSAGTSTGKAGEDAKAGANNAGSSSGSSSSGASSLGGSAAGGVSAGGSGSGGLPDGQAGAGNEAGSSGGGLVDCDPLKITCKRAAPSCGAGEVPSVDDVGNCYGDCVKIHRCACSTAAQCPDNNQYTCWAKQHCGPYVQ